MFMFSMNREVNVNNNFLEAEMRCNACWRELEEQAVTTTCGHLLCAEDANKILSNDSACPICDCVPQKASSYRGIYIISLGFDMAIFLHVSMTKPVEINPNDEWVNMAMAGISPQILMKSVYGSVTFNIRQKDLLMQFKMSKIVGQCRQKCEAMQEKFTEKWEQIYTAYQQMTKRCQMMEQEIENLSKEKQELQEKLAEKCRQKRKLDEMYDLARTEIESLKRPAIQPANHSSSRQDPDISSPSTRMNNKDSIRIDWSALTPGTLGPKKYIWPARQSSDSKFNISGGTPARQLSVPIDPGNRMPTGRSSFGVLSGAGAGNPSKTLRNLVLSPIKQRQPSWSRPQFT